MARRDGRRRACCHPDPAHIPDDVGDIGTLSRVDQIQKGTGSRLFAATRQDAMEKGLVAINATIRSDDTGGLAFYDRLGFVDHAIHHAVPLRDGTPIDRISKRYPPTAGT